jgi:hypothetical protein
LGQNLKKERKESMLIFLCSNLKVFVPEINVFKMLHFKKKIHKQSAFKKSYKKLL